MQSAVLAMIDSVCPSVCVSVTVRYHVKMTILGSSLEDSRIVFSWLTSARNSKGNLGNRGSEWERGRKNRQFSTNKSPYLRNGARWDHSHNDRLIGSRIRAFDWYQNHRPGMTLNSRYALYGSKDASFGTHCKNLNEDRLQTSAAKI